LSTSARDYVKLMKGATAHEFVDGGKHKVWMCPASPEWQEFYIFRDGVLVSEPRFGCDALYNDISISCAAPFACGNPGHTHLTSGPYMIRAYRDLLNRSHDVCAAIKGGQRVPIGTEVIVENYIDVIDFCHSRAMAGRQGAFEWGGDPNGMVESIPLFDYVYHEYGPVRLDGFAKLSRRFGEIFYLIAARVYLSGAILELNYEFSELELFDSMDGPSHYLTYDYWTEYREVADPARVHKPYLEFLRTMARARLGFGRPYLCWGRMMPPLEIISDVPRLSLDYDHFNVFPEQDTARAGTVETDAIITSGWAAPRGLGFFFANISNENVSVKCECDPARYGLKDKYHVDYVTQKTRKEVIALSAKLTMEFEVPGRDVVMLEFRTKGAVDAAD
ncbi:MAG: hypothetical protein JW941_04550, partial [Candidatus Coatesbacteria bacterium]|nr:hypothetical protein [Candidatus Coatesbacteria bacterium]